MKKRLYIIIGLMALAISVTFLLTDKKASALLTVNTVTVRKGNFSEHYSLAGQIRGNQHYLYFKGYIDKINCHMTDYLEKDKVILTYLDQENQSQQLKSSVNGFVEAIEADHVIMTDTDYYLEVMIPQSQMTLIKKDTEVSFTSEKKQYSGKVKTVNRYGQQISDTICYPAVIVLDNRDSLNLNQKGLAVFTVKKYEDVFLVDRLAIWESKGGFFLVDKDIENDPDNYSEYLIPVEVVASDQKESVVTGEMLENREVCIIDENVRRILEQ